MKKILLFILAVLFVYSPAHGKEKQVDVKFIYKYKKDGVYFRWAPLNKNMNYKYRLFRVEDKEEKLIGEFEKVKLNEIENKFSKEDSKLIQSIIYPQSLYKTDAEKLAAISQRDNQVGMAFFLAEFKPEIAKALGIFGHDKDAQPKKVYTYILKVYEQDKEVASKKLVVSTARFTPIYSPSVTAKRYEWGCALRWTNFDSYSGFNVYRSNYENKDYVKINKNPVGVNYIRKENGTIETPPYFYSDTNIDKEKAAYFYKVTGIDSFGDESELSAPGFAVRDSSLRPKPQMPVNTTIEEPYIKIEWNPDTEKNIRGYNLFRSSIYNGEYKKLNKEPIKGTFFMDKNVKYKVNYFYCHTAIDQQGNESVMSLPRLAVLRDRTPPAIPLNLKAIARKGEIILSWDKVFDDDLKGYEVYRGLSEDALDWGKLNNEFLKTEVFTDKISYVLDKKPYFYKVLAIDKESNRSDFSNIIKIKLPDVTPPKKPVWVSHEFKNQNLVLNWKNKNDSDFSSFNLYQGRGNKEKLIANVKENSFTYKIDDKVKDYYFFSISSLDSSQNESEKSHIKIKYIDKTKPVIDSFNLSLKDKRVFVNVLSSSKDLKTLVIKRKSKSDNEFQTIYSNVFMKEYIDLKIDKNKTYIYKVFLFDTSGNYSVSSEKKISVK